MRRGLSLCSIRETRASLIGSQGFEAASDLADGYWPQGGAF